MNEARGAGQTAGGGGESEQSAGEEDRAAMARVQQGDEAALGALMERWERPVKAVIGRLVFNATESGDLAQETFVRVWQQREKYRAGAEFRPWVFAIALNLARNRLRWWRRRPEVALQAWNETIGEGERGRGGEGERMERAERADAVREAIAALPVELREAIVLFEYEEMSHAEIAVAVGATPKAVETRIYRAKEKLRGALQRWV
ncbi:MAG: sigma-70 family RNA polymerase sigma factor [Opitutus sp.]|nr:sigma-70 family RNA polymerase sigma factor [Opitutus sp.]